MANAPSARDAGIEYQTWAFWDEACRLFAPHAKVVRVGFEHGEARAFDDVTVAYSTPIPDHVGGFVTEDYRQVKFNVDHTKMLTVESLTDPDAINAKTVSLLQRLRAAVESTSARGVSARFIFEATRPLAPDDPLAKIVSKTQGGALNFQKLFDGKGPTSTMGGIRASWREHLELERDDELQAILRPLRIEQAPAELPTRRRNVMDKIARHGFIPADADKTDTVYDSLILKWSMAGMKTFTRPELEKLAKAEGIWRGTAWRDDRVDLGIRSFTRGAEQLEDCTTDLLALESQFIGRAPAPGQTWMDTIAPKVREFLATHTHRGGAYTLHLPTHLSIAFLAGYLLDPKQGIDAAVMQPSNRGVTLWEVTSLSNNLPAINVSSHPLRKGPEVAAAISITRSIGGDVKTYAERVGLPLDRLIDIEVPLPAGHSVKDGEHAAAVAAAIANALHKQRSAKERAERTLHLFVSGPNGLTFFLGQQSRGLGKVQLYEHDFERAADDYQPSICLQPV